MKEFKTTDDLSEEQITACRGLLIYHLGGSQQNWTLGQHNEAGGYGMPLTPNEVHYHNTPKNFVVDLILRICQVYKEGEYNCPRCGHVDPFDVIVAVSTSHAAVDGLVRKRLIEMGWIPPKENQ